MPLRDNSQFLVSDLVKKLMHLGVDGNTIAEILCYIGRERWHAICDNIAVNDLDIRPTFLSFAIQLEEHCDRARGINVAMIGLREVLNEETSVVGAHQLTIDLANHAHQLRCSYNDLLNDLRLDHR